MRTLIALTAIAGIGSTVACNPSPTSPGALVPPGIHQSSIAAIMGTGTGGVSVTPKPVPEGIMVVDISVLVVDARPNTTYIVQRAADVLRTAGADGICQRALSLPPWSPADPPAPTFSTFPLGNGSATFTTAASGTGSINFEYRSPMIAAGTTFDVMFRLVDDETTPTTELRSGCFAVMVQ